MSITERLRSRPVATDTYTMAFDPQDAIELERLRKAVADAEAGVSRDPKATTARKALTAAKAALERHRERMVTITFTIEAIGASAIERLRNAHPATPEMVEATKASALNAGVDPDRVAIEFDVESYLPALMAESITEVTISDEDESLDGLDLETAQAMCEHFGQGDKVQLLATIEMLSMRTARITDLGKG